MSDPGSTSELWVAVGLRGGVELPLTRVFALRAHVDGDAIVTKYSLRLGGVTRYRYPAAAGGIGVALVTTVP